LSVGASIRSVGGTKGYMGSRGSGGGRTWLKKGKNSGRWPGGVDAVRSNEGKKIMGGEGKTELQLTPITEKGTR